MYFDEIPRQRKKKSKEEEIAEQIQKIKIVVDSYLTSQAKQRLKFVELAHPDKALRAYLYLYQLISSGQIRGKIDDKILKKLLEKISEATQPRFRIKKW